MQRLQIFFCPTKVETEEFMPVPSASSKIFFRLQNVAYRPTVYRTGNATIIKEISFKVTLSWSIPFQAQAALICTDEPYELGQILL